MTVAYFIRAHQRPRQLARLVDRLETPTARFFIHVSAITREETHGAMREALAGRPNVVWLPRVKAYYGGFSLVRATLLALEVIAREEPAPGHTVFLSGQDYPLQPAEEIEAFLARNTGTSLVNHFALPSDDWKDEDGGLNRVRHFTSSASASGRAFCGSR